MEVDVVWCFTFSLRRASLTGREMALGWGVAAVSAIVCGSRLQECQLSVQAVDRGGNQRVRCEMEGRRRGMSSLQRARVVGRGLILGRSGV